MTQSHHVGTYGNSTHVFKRIQYDNDVTRKFIGSS